MRNIRKAVREKEKVWTYIRIIQILGHIFCFNWFTKRYLFFHFFNVGTRNKTNIKKFCHKIILKNESDLETGSENQLDNEKSFGFTFFLLLQNSLSIIDIGLRNLNWFIFKLLIGDFSLIWNGQVPIIIT